MDVHISDPLCVFIKVTKRAPSLPTLTEGKWHEDSGTAVPVISPLHPHTLFHLIGALISLHGGGGMHVSQLTCVRPQQDETETWDWASRHEWRVFQRLLMWKRLPPFDLSRLQRPGLRVSSCVSGFAAPTPCLPSKAGGPCGDQR